MNPMADEKGQRPVWVICPKCGKPVYYSHPSDAQRQEAKTRDPETVWATRRCTNSGCREIVTVLVRDVIRIAQMTVRP